MDRIMIVEDNPVLLKILQSGMRKYENRFVTLTAKDGEEAIEILQNEPISLLVTDLQMPKVDGLTLLAYMNEHHPEIPCVVMSAHGTPQIKEKIARDVLRFIEKPFEIEELVETILPALENDQPGGTLNGISIANFLQMVHMEQKTCLLEIEIPDGRTGYFYFEEGVLFDAVFDNLQGEEAALALIPNERAKIRFKNLAKGTKKVTRRIGKDLMPLLMDAMRLKDESNFSHKAGIEEQEDEGGGFMVESEWVDPEDMQAAAVETGFIFPDSDDESPPPEATEPETAPEAAQTGPETSPPSAYASGARSTPAEAASALAGLQAVTGYRGSAVADLSGEVLIQDTVEPDLDLELIGAVALDLVRAGSRVAKETGLGECLEVLLSADGGILLCVSPARQEFHALVLLGANGNRALAKIALKKIMPSLQAALG
ncbi:MAG: response regulator [Desulfobacterales bacterium]|nr:response regulator [Desulfobacterales bacterium]